VQVGLTFGSLCTGMVVQFAPEFSNLSINIDITGNPEVFTNYF